MKRLGSWLVVGMCAALLGLALAPKANAQGTVEQSSFNLTEPLDIGGTILQPGDYQIKVVLLQGNRNLLRVVNADGTKVLGTVLSVPHQEGPGAVKIPASRYTYDTCYPFKDVGHAPNRFVVRASLVAALPPAAGGE